MFLKTFSLQQKLRHPDLIFCTSKLQKFTLNSRFSPTLEKANRLGGKSQNWGFYLAVMLFLLFKLINKLYVTLIAKDVLKWLFDQQNFDS